MIQINDAYATITKIHDRIFFNAKNIIEKWDFNESYNCWHFGNCINNENIAEAFESIAINTAEIFAVADTTIFCGQTNGSYFTKNGIISICDVIERLLGYNYID